MSPRARYLSTTLALVAVAVAYVVLQRPVERPAPRLPAWSLPAVRPGAVPPAPPTAREILDRAFTLDLRPDQMARLLALDRLWKAEARELEKAVQEAQRELSSFMQAAQGSRGATVQEIRRRSAGFSDLSAALRAGRQRHSEAALQLLAHWQRQRLIQMKSSATSGGLDEAGKN